MMGSRSAQVTLPDDVTILVVREMNARPALVWRAWTEPDLVARWWHAKRGRVTDVRIDLRVGGRWRHAMVTDDGTEVAFHGEYTEVVPTSRLVSTEVFEGIPDGESMPTLNTLALEDRGERTLISLLTEWPSREVRDAIIASGMEDGLQDALDLLEEAAASLG